MSSSFANRRGFTGRTRKSSFIGVLVTISLILTLFLSTQLVHADTKLKVGMFNAGLAATSNTINPHFLLTNTGSTSINLSTVKVRYFYTINGNQAQSFWCDWSSAGTANVTGQFVKLASPVSGADYYLEVSLGTGAGSLAPGANVEIQARFAKSDWSNYTQTDDYSFNPTSSSYVDWSKTTAYISGALVWGAEPGGVAIPTSTTGAIPTATRTAGPTATATRPAGGPTATATRSAVGPTATATRPAGGPTATATSTPGTGTGSGDRYFPVGTSVSDMQSRATNMTKQQVKALIEGQVDEHWAVISSKLGFTTKEKAYAFFLGMASRELTLNAGLETGGGSAHSYGPIQAAETAYANANPNYVPEPDVPEMVQYDFTPQNFYDAGISVHMGIRHLLHFANQAHAAGYTGVQLLRHALAGYNTGWVDGNSPDLYVSYSDEIAAMGGWYLNNGHLYDNAFTWTGSSAVDRSNPWGWY